MNITQYSRANPSTGVESRLARIDEQTSDAPGLKGVEQKHPSPPPVARRNVLGLATKVHSTGGLQVPRVSPQYEPPDLPLSAQWLDVVEPIRPADAMFLPSRFPVEMTVQTILCFEQPIEEAALIQLLARRLAPIDRLRHIPVIPAHFNSDLEVPSDPILLQKECWVEDPNFDVKRHVSEIKIPETQWRARIIERIEQSSETPFPQNRPPWEVILVQIGAVRSALILRISHALSDGVGILSILLSLSDNGQRMTLPGHHARLRSPLYDFFADPDQRQASLQALPKHLAEVLLNILNKPLSIAYQTVQVAQSLIKRLFEWCSSIWDVCMHPDAIGPLKRNEPVEDMKFSWLERTIPLSEIKAVAKSAGGTINDVIISCATTALREHQQALEEVEGVEYPLNSSRVSMPTNMKSMAERMRPDDLNSLGNHLSTMSMKLPLEQRSPHSCLETVVDQTRALKERPMDLKVGGQLMGLSGRMSEPGFRRLMQWGNDRSTLILSNMAGPTEPLVMSENPVDEIMWSIPLFNNIGLSLQVISYAGTIRIGMCTDRALIDEGDNLLHRLMDAYKHLADNL